MIKRVFPIIAVCVFAAQMGITIISPIISIYAYDLGATGLGSRGILLFAWLSSLEAPEPVPGAGQEAAQTEQLQ